MAGDSRPPLSHLRPTLSTRLRRSFEGKRSRPENGFSSFNGAPDPETLQTAIQQAISSEVFQNAIAANLANIIKPSITTALDTIQPVVEAVYAHDVLLRKTHRNVEDMLEKMDTIPEEDDGRGGVSPNIGGLYDTEFKALLEKSHKRTVVTLAELSNAVNTNTSKVAGLESAFGQSRENIEYLKSYVQNEMDQQRQELARITQLLESQRKAHSNTHSLVSAHANRLDVMSSDMSGLKAPGDLSEKLDSVSGELNILRASVDAGLGSNNGGFALLGSKIDTLAENLQGHGIALREIQQADTSKDVLAALQKSNDSHASHATILGTIHERSLVPDHSSGGTKAIEEALVEIKSQFQELKEHVSGGHNSHSETVNGIASKLDHVLATIEDQHSTDPSAEILEALKKANASHESHAVVLGDLREKALAPAPAVDNSETTKALESITSTLASLKDHITAGHTVTSEESAGLSTKIDSLLASIEQHKPVDSSADILAALQRSNDSHVSHASALDGLKSLVVVPAPIPDNSGIDRVEGHLQTIVETLTAHTTSLGDIKEASYLPKSDGNDATGISSITTTLDAQTRLLEEIKEDISAEILTALHDLGQTQASHTTTLAEIREADVSEEILTALHTSIEAHAGHQSEFGRLHDAVRDLDDKHERHAVNLDEIKTRSFEPTVAVGSRDGGDSALETKFGHLVASLEDQKETLLSIKQATHSSLDSHAAHALSLCEIKSRSLEPLPVQEAPPLLKELENKISSIIDTLEGQNATLSSIKDSTQAASDAHASSLNEIKAVATSQRDLHDSHSSTLSEIKGAQHASRELHTAHSATLADLVIATGLANDSHASHATTLAELKSLPPPPTTDLSGLTILEQDLKSIIDTLSHHTTVLAEIDVAAATPNPDILSALEKSHELLNAHTTVLESLKKSSPGSQDDVLATLTSVKSTVEDTRADIKAQSGAVKDLHSETKDSHSSLTTAIAAIAAGGAAGAGIGFLTSRGSNDDSGKDGNEEVLREIKAVREIVEAGVSLNQKGVEQLMTASGPFVTVREVDGNSVKDEDRSILNERGEVAGEAPVVVATGDSEVTKLGSVSHLVKDGALDRELTTGGEQTRDIDVDETHEGIDHTEGTESAEGATEDSGAKNDHQSDLNAPDAILSGATRDVIPDSQGPIHAVEEPAGKSILAVEKEPEDIGAESRDIAIEGAPTKTVSDEPSQLKSEPLEKEVDSIAQVPDSADVDSPTEEIVDVVKEKVGGSDELLNEIDARSALPGSETHSAPKDPVISADEEDGHVNLKADDEEPITSNADEEKEIERDVESTPLVHKLDTVVLPVVAAKEIADGDHKLDHKSASPSLKAVDPGNDEQIDKVADVKDTKNSSSEKELSSVDEVEDLEPIIGKKLAEEDGEVKSEIKDSKSPVLSALGDESEEKAAIEPLEEEKSDNKLVASEKDDHLDEKSASIVAKDLDIKSETSPLHDSKLEDAINDDETAYGDGITSSAKDDLKFKTEITSPILPAPTVETLDQETIDHTRQRNLTPNEDADDDMVVEWSGKDQDQKEDNDTSTVFETAVEEPITSSQAAKAAAKEESDQVAPVSVLGTTAKGEDSSGLAGGEKELGGAGSMTEALSENGDDGREVEAKHSIHGIIPKAAPSDNEVEPKSPSQDPSSHAIDKAGAKAMAEINVKRPHSPQLELDSVVEKGKGKEEAECPQTPKEENVSGSDETFSPVAIPKIADNNAEDDEVVVNEPEISTITGSSSHGDPVSTKSVKDTIDEDLTSTSVEAPGTDSKDEIETLLSSKLSIGDILQANEEKDSRDDVKEVEDGEKLSPVVLASNKKLDDDSIEPKGETGQIVQALGQEKHDEDLSTPNAVLESTKQNSELDVLSKEKESVRPTSSLETAKGLLLPPNPKDENPEDLSTTLEAATNVPVPPTPAPSADRSALETPLAKQEDDEADYFTIPSKGESIKSPTFSLPEETDSEPPTPATPGFSSNTKDDADDVVTPSSSGGGKKEKKGKKGKKTKNAKKEKVRFEDLEGEDPEQP